MFGTRKLGRTSDQRKAMLRAMTTYLLENGKMETTFTRAKEVQPVVEKMITLGKKKGLANYRKALSYITKEDVAHKLFEEIAPKYASRNGGYTRIIKIGQRLHPCAPHRAPQRRRSRDGRHRIGLIRSLKKEYPLRLQTEGVLFCAGKGLIYGVE